MIPYTIDADKFQRDNLKWSQETFPAADMESRFNHIKSEFKEILADPSDIVEWADVYILFFQAALEAGHTVTEIQFAALAKHLVNEKRTWGKPNAQGFTEHVKEDDTNV